MGGHEAAAIIAILLALIFFGMWVNYRVREGDPITPCESCGQRAVTADDDGPLCQRCYDDLRIERGRE